MIETSRAAARITGTPKLEVRYSKDGQVVSGGVERGSDRGQRESLREREKQTKQDEWLGLAPCCRIVLNKWATRRKGTTQGKGRERGDSRTNEDGIANAGESPGGANLQH